MKRRTAHKQCQGGLAGAFGPDDVFAVEALAHGDSGFAGDAVVGMDGLEAVALLGGVEDVAGFGPGGWDLRCEAGLVGEEEGGLHVVRVIDGSGKWVGLSKKLTYDISEARCGEPFESGCVADLGKHTAKF